MHGGDHHFGFPVLHADRAGRLLCNTRQLCSLAKQPAGGVDSFADSVLNTVKQAVKGARQNPELISAAGVEAYGEITFTISDIFHRAQRCLQRTADNGFHQQADGNGQDNARQGNESGNRQRVAQNQSIDLSL